MSACATSVVVDLGRSDRFDISWPIQGQSSSAVVAVELDQSGVWWVLGVADGYATGYFAGPDFASPAPANVVPTTSHAIVRVTDGRITVERDGGFIRLV